ncbi:Hint domain-containing protein [Brevirhabdus pacifica]|nr:Hint domain-containing protein [Brevirhabdus pacifica]
MSLSQGGFGALDRRADDIESPGFDQLSGQSCTGSAPHRDLSDEIIPHAPPTPRLWEIPCVMSGTRIATLRGMRPVETLREGDRIITHSRGSQRLQLIRKLPAPDLPANATPTDEAHAPVIIEAGAFGKLRPMEALVVSPQQPLFVRMSRGSGNRNRYNDTVPARYLVNDRTVTPDPESQGRSFYAIGFERPEVIQAENLPLACLSAAQITRLTESGRSDEE